jgi:hypothetical protein
MQSCVWLCGNGHPNRHLLVILFIFVILASGVGEARLDSRTVETSRAATLSRFDFLLPHEQTNDDVMTLKWQQKSNA